MKKEKVLFLAPGLFLLLSLQACLSQGQLPSIESKNELAPQTQAGQLSQKESSEWDRLATEAKREGRIYLYSVANGDLRINLIKAMKEKFSLEMDIVTGRAAELTAKLVNERKAGIYFADVYIGGAGSIVNDLIPLGLFDDFPRILLPEVLEPDSWWNKQITYVDKGKRSVAMVANPSPALYFNTGIVKTGEINSYRDLLNPKWKGKILINDPVTPGSAQFWFAIASNIMGVDYMRQLANMNPTVIRDQRLQVEWLAQGKFPIAIAAQTTTVTQFKKAGANLDQFTPIEGTHLTSSSGNIAMISNAPHPKAAQLFLNWMLTREAQTIYSRTTGHQSARADVPTDHIDQDKVRQPGVKYFSAIDEDFLKSLPEHARIAGEIFGPLLK